MFQYIRYELDADVALLRLDDGPTLNAMSTAMGLELVEAFARAEGEARAIVIGSVGRAFCSGANLTGGGFRMDDPERDVGLPLERAINPLLRKIRHSPLPMITAVRGVAAGVGCGLALAGDMIVAGEGAFFFQAFSKVGLTPDGGSTHLLARTIGRVRAMEMMMLGTRLPAARALEWGLVNRVVPDAEVDATALALARELAAGPRSLRMIRASAWSALDTPFEAQIEIERTAQRDAGRTEDFAEGLAAFKEKRPPAFRGR